MTNTEFRPLGRTGVQVSPLCLGCMTFGGRTDFDETKRIINRFVEAGFNFIDTADVYNRGVSEEYVGRVLDESSLRGEIILATKFFGRMGDGPNDRGSSAYHIVRACEDSLRRLKTDRIDLYQVHRPTSEIPIDETLAALDRLVRQGKVLYVGTTTFAAWQLAEAWYVAKELGLTRFVSERPPYNLLDRRIERELLPFCRTYGIAVIPWSPLAGGLLAGKYSTSNPRPADSRFTIEENTGTFWSERYNERSLAIADGVIALAAKVGCTPSALALAWCRDRPGVTSPIIGPRTVEQLEDNLASMSVTIDDETAAALDDLVRLGEHVAVYYEADFGPHEHRPL